MVVWLQPVACSLLLTLKLLYSDVTFRTTPSIHSNIQPAHPVEYLLHGVLHPASYPGLHLTPRTQHHSYRVPSTINKNSRSVKHQGTTQNHAGKSNGPIARGGCLRARYTCTYSSVQDVAPNSGMLPIQARRPEY